MATPLENVSGRHLFGGGVILTLSTMMALLWNKPDILSSISLFDEGVENPINAFISTRIPEPTVPPATPPEIYRHTGNDGSQNIEMMLHTPQFDTGFYINPNERFESVEISPLVVLYEREEDDFEIEEPYNPPHLIVPEDFSAYLKGQFYPVPEALNDDFDFESYIAQDIQSDPSILDPEAKIGMTVWQAYDDQMLQIAESSGLPIELQETAQIAAQTSFQIGNIIQETFNYNEGIVPYLENAHVLIGLTPNDMSAHFAGVPSITIDVQNIHIPDNISPEQMLELGRHIDTLLQRAIADLEGINEGDASLDRSDYADGFEELYQYLRGHLDDGGVFQIRIQGGNKTNLIYGLGR